MKLFLKILLFVFVALIANVKVINSATTFTDIQEITTFLSFNGETQKILVGIIENDLTNCCQNEKDLVDYRNWGTNVEAVAAKGGTNFLGQSISQGTKQLKWIMDKHGPNQLSKYAGKSQFYISTETELQILIQNSTHMPMTVQSGGNIVRTVNAGRTIGFDATTGKLTSIYSVITNPNGSLITAFPGLPIF